MSRFIQRSYAPRRSSLRTIGIPDAHDALAIYLRWARQAYYERENTNPRLPSSVGSVAASDAQQQRPSFSSSASNASRFDGICLTHDLLCIGAQFDEVETGGHMAGYPHDLDIMG